MSDSESGIEEEEVQSGAEENESSDDENESNNDENGSNNDQNESSDDEKESNDEDEVSDEDESNDEDSKEQLKPKAIEKKKKVKKSSEKSEGDKEIPFNKGKKKQDIAEKYEQLRGKQLFVRFPNKLPKTQKEVEEYVKNFNEKIIRVIRPRQKSCRHCLVEFDNETERNKSMKKLCQVEVEGTKLIVQLPKSESEEYMQKIVEYRNKKIQKMFEKKQTKKLAKENNKTKYTSTIIVSNIPSSATATDIKALYPDAIELRFTVAKGAEQTSQATITLPSTKDAAIARKKKLKIGENILLVKFAISKEQYNQNKENNNKKKNKKNKKKNEPGKEQNEPGKEKNEPSKDVAPANTNTLNKKNKQKNQKRKLTEEENVQEKNIVTPPKKKKQENVQVNNTVNLPKKKKENVTSPPNQKPKPQQNGQVKQNKNNKQNINSNPNQKQKNNLKTDPISSNKKPNPKQNGVQKNKPQKNNKKKTVVA